MSQSKKDPNRLTGKEAEEWFIQFGQDTHINSPVSQTLKNVVALLHKELPTRLSKARDNIYRDFPDGNEWIDSILIRKVEPAISLQEKQKFSVYLLDTVAATDSIVEIKDAQGNATRIAVDVTINTYEQKHKLNRIRGLPEPSDKGMDNRNANIGKVRKALGIDKHMVLLLNSDKRHLPSYEKLLQEINAFALSKSRTLMKDLQNVPETERFIPQSNAETPQRIWERYHQSFNIKDPGQRIQAIASQTFLDGVNPEIAKDVLMSDPIFERMKTQPAKAQKMASQTIDRVWEQMDLKISKVLKFARKKASQKGASVGKDQVFEGKNYIIRQSGTSVSIKAKDDRGILLSGGDQGYTLSGFSRNDLQRFETWVQRSKERSRRSRESRDMDFER